MAPHQITGFPSAMITWEQVATLQPSWPRVGLSKYSNVGRPSTIHDHGFDWNGWLETMLMLESYIWVW